MKKVLFFLTSLMFLGSAAYAGGTSTATPVLLPILVTISSVSTAGAPAQLTITSPTASGAFSTGYYNYLGNIHIEAFYTGGVAGANTKITCTTTNLPGNLSYNFGAAISTGTMQVTDMQFANLLQSSAASTNTTITCPATTNVLWNIVAGYYQGS